MSVSLSGPITSISHYDKPIIREDGFTTIDEGSNNVQIGHSHATAANINQWIREQSMQGTLSPEKISAVLRPVEACRDAIKDAHVTCYSGHKEVFSAQIQNDSEIVQILQDLFKQSLENRKPTKRCTIQ